MPIYSRPSSKCQKLLLENERGPRRRSNEYRKFSLHRKHQQNHRPSLTFKGNYQILTTFFNGFLSLLQKRQTFGSANLLSNLASQSQQQQQTDQIDRTQLLFDTIRAAQAAQQAQAKMEDSEEEPDAVVNPQEPANDATNDSKSDDEIEIIHTATDDV